MQLLNEFSNKLGMSGAEFITYNDKRYVIPKK